MAKKWIGILMVVMLLGAVAAYGATDVGFGRTVIGAHTSDTVDTATVVSPPAGARTLLVQAVAQPIRYTLDGTTPTASVGFRLQVGESILIHVVPNMTLTFIEETTDGSIVYQWGD